MEIKMFSVFDTKGGGYAVPFPSQNQETAMRQVITSALDPNTTLHQFPGDYSLVQVGHWDDDTGQFHSLPSPFPIATIEALLYRYRSMVEDAKVIQAELDNETTALEN